MVPASSSTGFWFQMSFYTDEKVYVLFFIFWYLRAPANCATNNIKIGHKSVGSSYEEPYTFSLDKNGTIGNVTVMSMTVINNTYHVLLDKINHSSRFIWLKDSSFQMEYDSNASFTTPANAFRDVENDSKTVTPRPREEVTKYDKGTAWSSGDNPNVEMKSDQRGKMVTGSLNIENCSSTTYEDKFNVYCKNVKIVDVGPHIPPNVTFLYFQECFASTVLQTPVLSHLSNLTYLTIYFCKVRFITSSFLKGLANLKSLDLQTNSIMVIHEQLFQHTPYIEKLDLRGNYIRRVNRIADAARLLKNLTQLKLDNNKLLEGILWNDLLKLENISLATLTLSDCALSVIEEGAFRPLKHLKTLVLSINPIGREALFNISNDLVFTEIESLEMRGMTSIFQGGKFITEEIQPLANSNISFLDLDSNYVVSLGDNAFPNITSLKRLSLSNCYINIISQTAFARVPALEELYVRSNRLLNARIEIPGLKVLDISYNPIGEVVKTIFELRSGDLQSYFNLQTFILIGAAFEGPITPNTFSGLNALKILEISGTSLSTISDFAFWDLVNLTRLALRRNQIEDLTEHTFLGLESLTLLGLDENIIQRFPKKVFNPLRSLEVLTLRQNKIKFLSPNLFSFNSHLELIFLSNNNIGAWNYELFSKNGSLRVLYLDNNIIDDVTPFMLNTFKRLQVLDLSGNTFSCNTCGMKRFQDWILRPGNVTIEKLHSDPELYTCRHPKYQNVTVLNATIPEELCMPEEDNAGLIALISVSFIAVLFICITAATYRFRWYLRYLIFSVRIHVKRYRGILEDTRYDYDAFVSYSSADVAWVAEHLVPRLEGPGFQFRLCLHDRDFMVGANITDNILESIDSSRKTIMVLTEDYVKSNWCMFELHMAQHRLFEKTRDALLLIKLSEVPQENLPKHLKYLMKTRTYIPWISTEDSAVGNKLFWKKLADALSCPERRQTLSRII